MNMRQLVIAFAVTLAAPTLVHADGAHKKAHGAAAEAAMATGEVRKVDKEAGKVTIKHGPLESLGMPPMTMVFRVADPAMLDKMKEGDKINFAADKVQGAFTVTKVEPAK